ncbi:hypothetical protein PM082_006952 [Marasmius tenuissimus]|nr:hypothetical protein PM082_006952 [Marasmius tenuissimus]
MKLERANAWLMGVVITEERGNHLQLVVILNRNLHQLSIAPVQRIHCSMDTAEEHDQNSQNITCRIPVEILSAIFHYLVQKIKFGEDEIEGEDGYVFGDDDEDGEEAKKPARGRWYSFPQVCRHWRQVAFSTPSLWTHIDFKDEWLSLWMLLRSQNAPLHLSISRGYKNGSGRLNRQLADFVLMQNIHRIAMLKLRVRDAAHMPPHIGGAPLLHSFHLECEQHYDYGDVGSEHPPLVIPDSLVGGPPRLRKLVINAVLSQYNIMALAKDLTSLQLTIFSTKGQPPRPSVGETLGIVQAALNLEMLCIQRKWSSELHSGKDEVYDIPPRNPHSAPHPLQRLRSLRFLGSMDCVNFLDYFTLPPSVSVEVEQQAYESISPALSRSARLVLSQFFLSSPIVSMVVGHDESNCPTYDLIYCAKLFPTDIFRIPFYGRRTPRLRLNYSPYIDDLAAMENLYNGLPLSHLHTLHLEYAGSWNNDISKATIEKYFASLPELHTITISCGLAIEVIPMLGQTAAGDQAQVANGPALLFPAVRTVWLHFLRKKWTSYPPDPEPTEVIHSISQELLRVLSVRKERGCGIENLVLFGCEFSTGVLANIQKIVGNVEVHSDVGKIIYAGLTR